MVTEVDPEARRLHPVLLLHGGGFVLGRGGYDAPLRELALASGCLIVSPECRLAPEHPFPAAADDALAAARWLAAEGPALGASDTRPAVTAECDPLRDDGERYAATLRGAGVAVELWRYPGMIHGFFQMTGALEAARRLHRELGDWMRASSPATTTERVTGRG